MSMIRAFLAGPSTRTIPGLRCSMKLSHRSVISHRIMIFWSCGDMIASGTLSSVLLHWSRYAQAPDHSGACSTCLHMASHVHDRVTSGPERPADYDAPSAPVLRALKTVIGYGQLTRLPPRHLTQGASTQMEDLDLEQVSCQGLVLYRDDRALCGLLETSLCQPSPGALIGQLFAMVSGSAPRGVLVEADTSSHVRSPGEHPDVTPQWAQPRSGVPRLTEAHTAADCFSPW